MDTQYFQHRRYVEMAQFEGIRRAIEQRRITILQQRGHLGMERAQHDQAARNIGGACRQPVHLSLQERTEV